MTDFAMACLRYRAEHNLSQAEMGKVCGVDRTIILDAEHDRPISRISEQKIKLILKGEKKV